MKKSIFILFVVSAVISLAVLFHGKNVFACEEKSVCGNGVIEKDEQCDDGNENTEDACSNECQKQIIKEVIKEVPVEKIVEKEVPVEKLVTVEKVVKEVVYKEKHDHDKDHKKAEKKKTLPKTGLPLIGLVGIALATTGAYGAFRKLKK